MSMKSPVKSPKRSVNSTHTVLFVMDVPKLATRVRERLARQRFVVSIFDSTFTAPYSHPM